MLTKGNKVEVLTKKAGQVPRHGTVVEVRGHDVRVKWDDGHESIISRDALRPVKD